MRDTRIGVFGTGSDVGINTFAGQPNGRSPNDRRVGQGHNAWHSISAAVLSGTC